jgi:FixJ family two-component response regulator
MSGELISIIDNDVVIRACIANVVRQMSAAVRCYDSAEAFLSDRERANEDCLVLELALPGMSGAELLETMKESGKCVPTIVVTASADVPQVVRAMHAGALTVLQKPAVARDLRNAIQRALAKSAEAREVESSLTAVRNRFNSLTAEERQVLDHVLSGTTNKAIAQSLHIALRTVEARRHSLMAKLRVDTTVALVRMNVEYDMRSWIRKLSRPDDE